MILDDKSAADRYREEREHLRASCRFWQMAFAVLAFGFCFVVLCALSLS